jgi:hypothetical protein
MSNIYPKAQAPLTEVVLQKANDRAERWMNRYRKAVAERDAFALRLKEYEDD